MARSYLKSVNISEQQVEWVEDPAFSAFHGDHVTSGALGKLLRRVRDKAVSGGLLIFESVDRASRQGSMALLAMLNEFLEAGFSIYFLDQPEQEPFDKISPPPFFFTYLSLKADVARFESLRKSDLSSKNWEKRRELARNENLPLTRESPRWLRVEEDKYRPDPQVVESIRKTFELARDGWGVSKIVRKANAEKWPIPGKGITWHTSLLNRLFANRALIGELQLYTGTKSRKIAVGEPIPNYYPVVIEPDLFHSVRGIRDKASQFPNRRDLNNHNYLMGLGKCECGGTWRRLNKNSGKQKGYAQYSCSNRQLGVKKCRNLPSRVFDYFFIGVACEKIPNLLTVVDNKREVQRESLESQLADIERKLGKLLDLYETNDELQEELLGRLYKAKKEKNQIKEALSQLENFFPLEGPFDFGDAVAAYLPAFLNVFTEENSVQAQSAFHARALFRIRLLQSVELVVVAHSRESMKIRLKNGAEFEQEIRHIEFTTDSDYDETEIEEMEDVHLEATEKLLGIK